MPYEPRWRRLQVRCRGDSGEARNRASELLAMVAQSCVMRAIPRLLTAAELDLCWSRGYLVADIGRADFFAAAVASFRVLLPRRARCPRRRPPPSRTSWIAPRPMGASSVRATSTPTLRVHCAPRQLAVSWPRRRRAGIQIRALGEARNRACDPLKPRARHH